MDNARCRLGVVGTDAEQAVDAADNATDGAADHCANRTRDPAPLIEAVSHAAGNALSLGRQRHRGENKKYACNDCGKFHARYPCFFVIETAPDASTSRRFSGDRVAALESLKGLRFSCQVSPVGHTANPASTPRDCEPSTG